MSTKRPGVSASVRLSHSLDATLWKRIEAQYESAIGSESRSFEANVESLEACARLSKKQLMDLVDWKFSVGKPRYALMKLLRANSESSIKEHTETGIQLSEDGCVKDAISEVAKLQGVGPATASALLCRISPNRFCYMYDEAIDVFRPKRDYTINTYLEVNKECARIGKSIGWTPARVARTLWIAARVSAHGELVDHTKSSSLGKENSKRARNCKTDQVVAPKALKRRMTRRSANI